MRAVNWTYDPESDFFTGDRGQRMRRENLPCTEQLAGVQGRKHDWESWGIATITTGTAGARDVIMKVCRNPECMHVKYGRTICKN